MVSGIGMLEVEPLGPVGLGLGFPRIRLVSACPKDAGSDLDLGNAGARSTHLALSHIPRVSQWTMRFRWMVHVKWHPR